MENEGEREGEVERGWKGVVWRVWEKLGSRAGTSRGSARGRGGDGGAGVTAMSGIDSCAARHSTSVSFAVWWSNAAFNWDSEQLNDWIEVIRVIWEIVIEIVIVLEQNENKNKNQYDRRK